jgi:hypothetical protein
MGGWRREGVKGRVSHLSKFKRALQARWWREIPWRRVEWSCREAIPTTTSSANALTRKGRRGMGRPEREERRKQRKGSRTRL